MFYRRCPKFRPDHGISSPHGDLMIEILSELAGREREALLRFYVDRQAERQIEVDLGLSRNRLQELRQYVKAAFVERQASAMTQQ